MNEFRRNFSLFKPGEKKEKKDKDAKKPKSAKSASVKAKDKTKTSKKKASAKTTSKRKGKATAKPDAKPVVVLTHDQIAQKAYEIWLAKGKPHGQDQQNWDEAKAALEQIFN